MAVIIAFKQPSEMTNDIAGALAFPKTWSFANFSEAMKVTDFWHSLKQFTSYDRDRDPCYSDPFSGGVCDWKKYGK